jgi:FlaA1/EpsC-like NDP-sugar epimerase
LFERHRPHYVFHSAAYKHVPLLESNTHDGFVNNVVGTRTVVAAARRFGTRRLVLLSTDKAADPSSLLGHTKRLAELLVKRANRAGDLETAVVRFGNVIDSAGSVVPTFRQQLAAGGPLTVTDPAMTRYFISTGEAVHLVLTAATAQDGGGRVYLLDMGRPIRIVELARALQALAGRSDVPIVFTGRRPGEKLHEALHGASEVRRASEFDKISVLTEQVENDFDVEAWIDGMTAGLHTMADEELAARVRQAGATSIPAAPAQARGWRTRRADRHDTEHPAR